MRPIEKRVANFTIPGPMEPTREFVFHHGLGTDVLYDLSEEFSRFGRRDALVKAQLGDGFIKFTFPAGAAFNGAYKVVVIG